MKMKMAAYNAVTTEMGKPDIRVHSFNHRGGDIEAGGFQAQDQFGTHSKTWLGGGDRRSGGIGKLHNQNRQV